MNQPCFELLLAFLQHSITVDQALLEGHPLATQLIEHLLYLRESQQIKAWKFSSCMRKRQLFCKEGKRGKEWNNNHLSYSVLFVPFFPSISTKTNFFIVITKRKENGEGHNIVSYLVALKVKLHFSHTCTLKQNVLTLLILALCKARVSWYKLSNSLALHRVSVAQWQSIGGARNPMV